MVSGRELVYVFIRKVGKMKSILKKIITLCLTVTLIVSTCGCGVGKYRDLGEDKLLIVTTLFPQYDFARQIAGDRADVVLLLSPGVEAHDFEPTPSDIILINKADLFIYTGDEMEPWVATILAGIDNQELNVLDVSEGIELICEEENHEHNHVHEGATDMEDDEAHNHEEEHSEEDDHEESESVMEDEHDHDEASHSGTAEHEDNENVIFAESDHSGHDHSHTADPHIWTSPVNAMKMIESIEHALVELDEAGRTFYEENAHEYIHGLEEVDSKLREIVKQAHTHTIYFGGRFAMSYFTHEYGLTYAAAFDSCQAESEPSARLIVGIIEKMREDGAKYVFYEEMTDPKAARIIAEEIDGEILLLHSCHNVSKSELEAGVTYLSLMQQNVENLEKALQ